MRQLTDVELDERIHKFMRRKLAEFPELADDVRRGHKWHGKLAQSGNHHHKFVGGVNR